jgi:anthranilate phosphoribosyltransferase
VDSLTRARDIAETSIDSGAALNKLDQLAAITNRETE